MSVCLLQDVKSRDWLRHSTQSWTVTILDYCAMYKIYVVPNAALTRLHIISCLNYRHSYTFAVGAIVVTKFISYKFMSGKGKTIVFKDVLGKI